MRKLLQLIVIALCAGTAGYVVHTHQSQLQSQLQNVAQMVTAGTTPCNTPVTYSIGTIDSRFGISKSVLISSLEEAQAIWNTPAKKKLLQYELSGGTVSVNLVYDSRQAATDKLKAAGLQINTDKTTYDSLKSKYDVLFAQIGAERSAYQSHEATYKQDVANYNAEVADWNKRGGAPPSAYQQLQQQKESLQTEFDNLKAAENTLNANIDTLNALATVMNQLIVQLNLNVQQYNQTGAAEGQFEEGLYEESGSLQTIDIYEYSNHVQLVRVLAHEMGHALGLQHVSDPDAIMYKINLGTSLKATPSDVAELGRICQVQTDVHS